MIGPGTANLTDSTSATSLIQQRSGYADTVVVDYAFALNFPDQLVGKPVGWPFRDPEEQRRAWTLWRTGGACPWPEEPSPYNGEERLKGETVEGIPPPRWLGLFTREARAPPKLFLVKPPMSLCEASSRERPDVLRLRLGAPTRFAPSLAVQWCR